MVYFDDVRFIHCTYYLENIKNFEYFEIFAD